MKYRTMQKIIKGSLFVALGILTLSFGHALKRNLDDDQHKEHKISVLVQEVGALKERLDAKELTVNQVSEDLYSLDHNLNNLNKNLNSILHESPALKAVRQQLQTIIEDQKNTIGKLSETNKTLHQTLQEQEILDMKANNNEMLHFLVVGKHSSLTDTIILASINHNTRQIDLVSIPRDLYYNGRKINELYSKYGIKELQQAIKNITGVYAQQYAVFNFEAFKTIVDEIGGIEVQVPAPLVDRSYPAANHTITTVAFQAGNQTMNGARALQYARSRKSSSDFDRSKRQQQIMQSIATKAKEQNLIFQPERIIKLYAKIQQQLVTNIGIFEALNYWQRSQTYTIKPYVLSTSNHLYSSRSSTGQYILLPRSGGYSTIKKNIAEHIAS